MAKINLIDALKEVVSEKNLPMEVLLGAIEEALVVAYRKNFDSEENITVTLDKETGDFRVISKRVVAEGDDLEDPDREYTLEEAREIDPEAQPGDIVEEDVTPPSFGRIATQTARQVVGQKLKEAERDIVYEEFKHKIGQIMTGKVQRVERGSVYVEFAKAEGVLGPRDQIPGEMFRTNDRIKCYVKDVKPATRGPQIVLSRSCTEFVEILFKQAVPEIEDGIVEIKSSSREAGLRVKISVMTTEKRVDPVGACVGLKGSRIRGIVDELNGEKIDIVRFSENPEEYVTNALSPAKIDSVRMLESSNGALAIVSQSQLSLAIGKEGQNVKLASKLTGIKIDIKTQKDVDVMNLKRTDD